MTDDVRKNFDILLKCGEYAEAERLLNWFIEQHPEDREAKMLLGTCRMRHGDTETAGQVKESLNKPGDSIFHVIVTVLSVFVFFYVFPWILFVSCLLLLPILHGAGCIFALTGCILYPFLVIYYFRESKDGDENEDQ